MGFDTTNIKKLIFDKLDGNEAKYADQFQASEGDVGTRYVVIDGFLPEDVALKAYQAFQPNSQSWREMKSFREKKLTTKQYNSFPDILGEVTFAFQDPEVVDLFAKITGISGQQGDRSLYAGGLSMMREGDFLNPHIDNSHDQDRKLYRRLNLLYYVTPEWELSNGGNLELWEESVKRSVTIESKFNRLVLMETNHQSWHSVSKVKKTNCFRCCVSNYYFSQKSPLDYDYFHITKFKGRPDEPVKRFVSDVDSFLRNAVRYVKKTGFGKKDLYQGKP